MNFSASKEQYTFKSIFICFFLCLLVLTFISPAQSQNNAPLNVVTWVHLEGALINDQGSETYSLPLRTELGNSKMLPGQCFNSEYGIKYTPAGQPYNVSPWFYNGNEGDIYDSFGDPEQGSAGYPETCVDWILVSLRSTPDGESLCRKAGLLHNDGHVEFDSPFTSDELALYSSFYIVIEHRNHLIIMSSNPITPVNGTITYDFRYSQSYIDDPFNFGAVGQKELSGIPGTFAMFSGNSDQTKTGNELPGDRIQINGNDWNCWSVHNGIPTNYCCSDFNLNSDCNYNDRATIELNNGLFTSVPVE